MKQKSKNNPSNVIPFPKLEERLLNKGMDALKEKRYKEALQIFNQFIVMNPDYPEVEVGIVVCLLELGLYEDAKEECERLLNQDVGDYFNVLQIYITILIQLSEYKKVVSILEALFEEERVPAEHAEELFHLLEFSRKSSGHQDQMNNHYQTTTQLEVLEHQLIHGNIAEKLQVIQKLREIPNISSIHESMRNILADQNSDPIVQSMVLQLMIEKQIDETVVINKFGRTIAVTPSTVDNIFEQPFTIQVLNKLDDTLGQENPTLFESVNHLWERFLLTIFPFHPEPKQALIWAAGLHKIGYELLGIPISYKELKNIYDVSSDDLEKVCHEIMEIEKLSNIGINE